MAAATTLQNIGVGNPTSEINYTSGLNPIMALIQSMIGSKETSTSKGTESTTTGGDRAMLDELFAKLSGPSDLEAVVNDLFAKGAAQVPALTTQFANATGTRTTNNSMLAQSLAGVNTNLASQIAQYAVQQQNVKDQLLTTVAGKVADTTRTQQVTKDATGEKATAPNISLASNPIGTLAGLGFPLAGFLANKTGKTVSPLGSGGSTGGTPSGIGESGTVGGGVQNTITPDSLVFSGNFEPGVIGTGTTGLQLPTTTAIPNIQIPRLNIGGNPADVPTQDASQFEPTTGNPIYMDPATGMDASIFDPATGNPWDDLGDFFDFANGGLVGRRIAGREGYADGGMVRNKNYLKSPSAGPVIGGTPALQIVPSTPVPTTGTADTTAGVTPDTGGITPQQVVLSIQPPPEASVGAPGSGTAPTGPTPKGPNGLTGDTIPDMAINKLLSSGINELITSSGVLDSTVGAGAAGAGEAAAGVGAAEAAGAGVGEAAAAGSAGGPVGMGIAVAVALLMNELNKDKTKAPSFGLAARPDGSFGVTQADYMKDFDPFWREIDSVINSGIYDKNKLAGLTGPRDVYGTPQGTAGNLFKSIDSARTGNFDNAWFKGWNDRVGGATAPYVPPEGLGPTQTQFSEGGKVKGPGTSSSDSIPINVSRDEYILPADVVKYIGVDMLDNLVATIHKPVAGGSQRA